MTTLEQVIEQEVQRRVDAALKERMTPPPVFTVDEAAKALRVSRSTIYNRIKDGDIATTGYSRRILIPLSEIERLTTASAVEG